MLPMTLRLQSALQEPLCCFSVMPATLSPQDLCICYILNSFSCHLVIEAKPSHGILNYDHPLLLPILLSLLSFISCCIYNILYNSIMFIFFLQPIDCKLHVDREFFFAWFLLDLLSLEQGLAHRWNSKDIC